MTRARAATAAAVGIAMLVAGLAMGDTCSRLALPILASETAPMLLAQRSIERRWGTSDDSVYTVVDIPNWRDEGAALTMSAAVPGVGQVFVGDRLTGLAFAAAEAFGWISRWLWRERGKDLRDEARVFAGSPQDPVSAWSFDRWETATRLDAGELKTLYDADRESFYDLIGSDERYLAGWNGDAHSTRGVFREIAGHAEARMRNARYAEIGLWVNHVAAAAHALRAARLHNIPLRRDLELRIEAGWRNGPTTYAMVERRF